MKKIDKLLKAKHCRENKHGIQRGKAILEYLKQYKNGQ